MKKLCLGLFLILMIGLFGCEGNSNTTSEDIGEYYNPSYYNQEMKKSLASTKTRLKNYIKEEKKGIYDFKQTDFTYLIPQLSKVTSVKEVADVMDYCAFYHIETMNVVLDFKEDCQTIINEAFWLSTLLPGSVGVDGVIDEGLLKLHFFFYDANTCISTSIYDSYSAVVEYPFAFNTSKRTSDFSDFAYTHYEKKASVYNSEQLFYVLENGYEPIVFPDSPASLVLEKAKEVLREIVSDDMNEKQKVIAIYNYVISHAYYDGTGDEAFSKAIETKVFGDSAISLFRSNYIEGFFFDQKAVCHGFSKTCNLLMSMEGISTKKVSGFKGINYRENRCVISSQGYLGHGYSFVKLSDSDNYYFVDPTFVVAGTVTTDLGKVTSFRSPGLFLSRKTWGNVYVGFSDAYQTILPSNEDIDCRILETFAIGENSGNFYCTNESELKNVLNYLKNMEKNKCYSICIYIPSYQMITSSVKEELEKSFLVDRFLTSQHELYFTFQIK